MVGSMLVLLGWVGCKAPPDDPLSPGGASWAPLYESANLIDYDIAIEPNPGGGTDCPYEESDVGLAEQPEHLEVTSNVNERNVWVNAIAHRAFVEAFDEADISLGTFRYTGEIRLPSLPAPDPNQRENAGGVHAMIQLWDGRGALVPADYHTREFTLYWELNPWSEGDYGAIFVYTGEEPSLHATGIKVEPDTDWHSFVLVADLESERWVSLSFDEEEADVADVPVARVDHTDWSADTRVVLNLTAESLSAWPQAQCSHVFTWTTQYRNVALSRMESR